MWRRKFKKGRDDDKNVVHTSAGGETIPYIGSYEEFGGSTGGDGGDGGGGDGGGGNGGGAGG